MSFLPPVLSGRLALPTLLLGWLLVASLPACTRELPADKGSDRPATKGGDPQARPAGAAEDQAIRRMLAEKLKEAPPVDEIRTTSIPGLFEVRFGTSQILYTDATGRYLIEGSLIDLQTMSNLTEARLDALTAVDFAKLPLKDAVVYKQGDGSRKLAVFADPNCGYCRRFERDLMALPNVTLYTFIMPILGADSVAKARNIWCTGDPAKAWRGWMIDGVAAAPAGASCDASALSRNAEFGRKHRINATPGLIFSDGSKRSGAMSTQQVEAMLAAVARKS